MYRVPKNIATRPDVGGTVASHKNPMTALNNKTLTVDMGNDKNAVIAIARLR